MPFESPLRLWSYKKKITKLEIGGERGRLRQKVSHTEARNRSSNSCLPKRTTPSEGVGEGRSLTEGRLQNEKYSYRLLSALREYDSILHSHIKQSAFSHILERDHRTVSRPHTLHLTTASNYSSLCTHWPSFVNKPSCWRAQKRALTNSWKKM